MDRFQNINLAEYFKRYGFINSVRRGIFMANKIHFVNDYEERKILYYRKVRKMITRKYIRMRNSDPIGLSFEKISYSNPIWVYWKQGMSNAPEIVQKCYSSLLNYSTDPVILITEENLKDFVTLPRKIISKLNAGTMSAAAFSDLLRFSLLEHYGGTWIDATVMLTGRIPEYILESDFFAYRDCYSSMDNPALYASWLLHCNSGNQLMKEIRNVAFAYLEKEKYVNEYLWSYLIITLIVEKHPEEIFPYLNSDYATRLLGYLNKPFDNCSFNSIREKSTIHKLSYKLDENTISADGTFYRKLVKDCGVKC